MCVSRSRLSASSAWFHAARPLRHAVQPRSGLITRYHRARTPSPNVLCDREILTRPSIHPLCVCSCLSYTCIHRVFPALHVCESSSRGIIRGRTNDRPRFSSTSFVLQRNTLPVPRGPGTTSMIVASIRLSRVQSISPFSRFALYFWVAVETRCRQD